MPDTSAYSHGLNPPKPNPPPLYAYGLLTSQEQEKILLWFQEKFSTNIRAYPKCEMCGTNGWVLGQHTVTPMMFSKEGLQLGGHAYPQVMLSCAHCGNTKFFSAVQMGIVKREDGPNGK
jgi:predicted nucleic-acid-binding Zn-ribbon protein